MLIKCTECELQVSDKALACPHCGYPLDARVKRQQTRKSTKRRRLPNGFGQITEIKNRNLRNPFRASVTVGKTTDGRFIRKLLKPEAFFPTYNDAYMALVEYNRNPYDLDVSITVKELYDKWSEEYFATLKSESSTRTITSAWAYCSSIYDMRAKDVRVRHIQGCMNDGIVVFKGEERRPSANIKSRIKSMFNLMFDYAMAYEIVDRNYARMFELSTDIVQEKEATSKGHIPFTDNEIEALWDNVDKIQYVDIVLIQAYSGWRPQELGLIKIENVDLKEWSFSGGMKTNAGTNRIVPIHPKIRHLVKQRYKEAVELGSDYLINCTDTSTHRSSLKFTYDKYRHRFNRIVERLDLNKDHRAHDPRKHFVTICKKYKVDEYAIKYMIGHQIDDLTERVYTQRELSWLREEIEKIK